MSIDGLIEMTFHVHGRNGVVDRLVWLEFTEDACAMCKNGRSPWSLSS